MICQDPPHHSHRFELQTKGGSEKLEYFFILQHRTILQLLVFFLYSECQVFYSSTQALNPRLDYEIMACLVEARFLKEILNRDKYNHQKEK